VNQDISTYWNSFQNDISGIELPEKFTFPFYYKAHPLTSIASEELQERISEMNWAHNFGVSGDAKKKVIGKMFGVLVVQKENGELGYLAAFSGKVADSNHHAGFVPPVYDMLEEGSFFNVGMGELQNINKRVAELESNEDFTKAKEALKDAKETAEIEIENHRELMRQKKAARKVLRESSINLSEEELEDLQKELSRESLHYKYQLKALIKQWNEEIERKQTFYNNLKSVIDQLKSERKAKSAALQQRIFDEYHFLNANKETRSLGSIFEETALRIPPSGSGECAAPKLLQFAYLNDLKPIAMAEFWWGESPKSEIRKHKHFYPSCRGKCEPILGHMLQGLIVDDNPIIAPPKLTKELEIVYEDDVLIIVNKPYEFLSVPGKTSLDSVYDRIKAKYPDATGPLIIHRLDMATSGLLILTKTKEANKFLQEQFIRRSIKKRYVALLDGELKENEGLIDLPLRLDINDRPRQLVCYEFGKHAQTRYEVIERKNGTTRVYFYPITGRSHQLRVHAAHSKGLNTPIVGDDLYGKRDQRLHLHAEHIEFVHPNTREKMSIQVDAEF
jgi:tRNA pseudouridine32 synthase/23S rRNA pseudouridine746 synthase